MNARYYRELHEKLEDIIEEYAKEGYDIKVFREHPSYIGGEETALLNAIERRTDKSHTSQASLSRSERSFWKPTYVHNVETLLILAAVENGTYDGSRFYFFQERDKHPGVYHLPADWSSWKVLEATGNEPAFSLFYSNWWKCERRSAQFRTGERTSCYWCRINWGVSYEHQTKKIFSLENG